MNNGAMERLSDETTAGNYFVSNYPPYSLLEPGTGVAGARRPRTALRGRARRWASTSTFPSAASAATSATSRSTPDKDSAEIDRYLDAVVRELTLYAAKAVHRRTETELHLFRRRHAVLHFDAAAQPHRRRHEAPASLGRGRGDRLRVRTRHHHRGQARDPQGRWASPASAWASRTSTNRFCRPTAARTARRRSTASYQFARSIGFPQINIDLIAGMVGETDENWRECVRKTIALSPDSVTIYQMESPVQHHHLQGNARARAGRRAGGRLADQARAGSTTHFREMEKAGYTVTSAYTAVKDPARTRFLYRDLLWTGADMIGLGVASFSHVNGTHFQNEHDWDPYIDRVHQGQLPDLSRAHADRGGAHDPRVHSADEARARPPGILPAASSESTCASGSPPRWNICRSRVFCEWTRTTCG